MNRLINLPFIGNFIREINDDAERMDLQGTMKNVIKKSRSKLIIKGINEKLENILKHKPVILVVNHPNDAEVLALIASLPKRNDIYLIINRRMTGVVPNLDKYLIPVYIDHHFNPKTHNKIISYLLRKYHPKPLFSPEEEHRQNINSISIAAQRVNEGGLIIIFPGRRSIDGHWFTGVGHLLKEVNNNNVYIVRVCVQGTSLIDYLRIIPGIGYFLPTVTINFTEPLKLEEIFNNDPKQITKILENLYNKWTQTIVKI